MDVTFLKMSRNAFVSLYPTSYITSPTVLRLTGSAGFPAASFPDGVMDAFKKLHAVVPDQEHRRLFGISWPDGKGSLVYKAAVEEGYAGETQKLGAESYILKHGEYLALVVHNFMDDIPSIGKAFRKLVNAPGVHPDTIGVEEYISSADVRWSRWTRS